MDQIDFVIIWVDAGDPVWRKEKDRWLHKTTVKPSGEDHTVDAGENRYRDWDNLKYWFRAVEKYAPWVNKVHFVTCGHVPPWLNLEAPKLNFVKHRDYIPEKYLPTFSSHPIELNLHRIPALSDKFVYFNDDFFLGAPVKPEDFFKDGLPCDCVSEQAYRFGAQELYSIIRLNDMIYCNRNFKRKPCIKALWKKWFSMKTGLRNSLRNFYFSLLGYPDFFGFDIHHLPQAYLKSTLEEVWEREPDWLDETCSHKFRDLRDLSQHAFKFHQLLSGNFSPYNVQKYGKYFDLGKDLQAACDAISGQGYKLVCLNDANVSDFEGSKEKICRAFQQILPEKSSFER